MLCLFSSRVTCGGALLELLCKHPSEFYNAPVGIKIGRNFYRSRTSASLVFLVVDSMCFSETKFVLLFVFPVRVVLMFD